MVVATLSKTYGWEFYEKLRANDIMIVQGHQQVEDMLKRGERVIAAEGLDSYAYDDRKAGIKVATIYPTDGTFAVPSPTAIIKGGPNPNAAKALAEFMIGDVVQAMFPADGHYAARVDMPAPQGNPPLSSLKLITVDYDEIQREEAKVKDHFNEIFQ
jgi:iron(III) transport system substrate-binding protein